MRISMLHIISQAEDLEKSTECIFQGYPFFSSNWWHTDEIYEAEVQAVVEQQHLPKVPVPIQHMAIFCHSVAEPVRDVLKLLILGYVQANSASRRQWRQWIDAADFEGAKVHGGILYNNWFGTMGVGRLTQHDLKRRLSKIIEWLKQAGEGARGVFKGG